MWEDADTFCQLRISVGQLRTAVRKSLVPRKLYQLQLRMLLQKRCDRLLIFFRRKGTGRIQQQSARSEHAHCLTYNLMLRLRTFLHLFQTPYSGIRQILPEHTLSRARSIHQDFIKCPGKLLCKLCRIRICDKGIPDTENFQILEQCFCTGSTDIVRHEQSLTRELCTERRRLSARCRT